jgi:hypothetical protein
VLENSKAFSGFAAGDLGKVKEFYTKTRHFFGFAFFTADFLAPFFALLPRSRTLSELPLPGSALAAW